MVVALLRASTVALALDIQCPPGNSYSSPCTGTFGNDRMHGTSGLDVITLWVVRTSSAAWEAMTPSTAGRATTPSTAGRVTTLSTRAQVMT